MSARTPLHGAGAGITLARAAESFTTTPRVAGDIDNPQEGDAALACHTRRARKVGRASSQHPNRTQDVGAASLHTTGLAARPSCPSQVRPPLIACCLVA